MEITVIKKRKTSRNEKRKGKIEVKISKKREKNIEKIKNK